MTLHCCQHQVYAVTRQTKIYYIYVKFKNVFDNSLVFLLHQLFSSTMLYCIRVSRVSTRSYLSTMTSNLLTFFKFVCLGCFLVVGSFGIKNLGGNMRLVDVPCGRLLYPSSSQIFRNVFKKSLFLWV